ncbi:uncharacterized protein LOC106640488 [Copidosoma floridanum]|uniref:uncharacterized protein LOC106640488 n=1 Tax=Copidosoma floridanum TaxID=29053 RepID=UPI0006C9B5F7|nr:uncharacterized protein LOC106640488 [Copidosoma floridanum]
MMKFTLLLLATVVLFNVVTADKHTKLPNNYGITENCPCLSTDEYLPLCASNKATYSNAGMFECAKRCLRKDDLVKVKDGEC